MAFSNNNNTTGRRHGAGGATELSSTDYGAGTGPNVGGGAGGMTQDPRMMNNAGAGAGAHTGTVGMGEPGMGNPGMTSDPAYGTGAVGGNQGLPPTTAANAGTRAGTHGGAGGGSSMAGRVEQAVGSLVGSNTLKAKGAQKEQEARALKAQSTEIGEAERLEREAAMRRERAVGHGAHPEHRHLGGPGGAGAGAGTGAPGTYN